MADIFQEIEEDLRRDRFLSVWRRYGAVIVTLAVIVAAGVAGYFGWQKWQSGNRASHAEALSAAMTQAARGDSAAAAKAFQALAESAGGGYGALARLDAAAAKRAAGDRDGAIADYDAVAADGDATLATIAALLAVQTLFDEAPADDLARRLGALPTDGPWGPFADELRALAALKAGRTDDARRQFAALQDNSSAPGPLRDRAGQLLTTLGGPLEAPAPSPQMNEQPQP